MKNKKLRATSELHKFMSADRAMHFLSDLSIRFTQPNFLNDPYECHLTFDRKTRQALLDDFGQGYRMHFPERSEEEIQERILANEGTVIEDALLRYRRIRNDLGVLSLTQDPLNLLMWAHYGDEHKGMVIEIDFTHPSLLVQATKPDEFSGLFAVRYKNEKVSGLPTPDNVIETLLTKSLEWEYEKEWRFVRTLNLLTEVKDDIFVANIAPEAIRRIIIGARFPSQRLSDLMKYIENEKFGHVVVEKAVMIPNRFWLKLVDAKKFGWTLMHREHHFGDLWEEALLCVTMDEDEEEFQKASD